MANAVETNTQCVFYFKTPVHINTVHTSSSNFVTSLRHAKIMHSLIHHVTLLGLNKLSLLFDHYWIYSEGTNAKSVLPIYQLLTPQHSNLIVNFSRFPYPDPRSTPVNTSKEKVKGLYTTSL